MNTRERIEAGIAIGVVALFAYAMLHCGHVPLPVGGNISETEAGIETCIDWARTHCPSCGDGGTALYDAGYGL